MDYRFKRGIDDLGDAWMRSVKQGNSGIWRTPDLVTKETLVSGTRSMHVRRVVYCLSTYIDGHAGVDGVGWVARPITPNVKIAEAALR